MMIVMVTTNDDDCGGSGGRGLCLLISYGVSSYRLGTEYSLSHPGFSTIIWGTLYAAILSFYRWKN